MSPITRRWFVLAAPVLAIASAAVIALLGPDEVMPIVGNPFSVFVQPGVTVWWLVIGGTLFSTFPSSPTAIAFAAAANVALWLLVLWFVVAIVRAVRRTFAAPPL